tara:strand:+ start:744 stop:929 length:186 start_codon:yes stop_codon:yes gene_type:complete
MQGYPDKLTPLLRKAKLDVAKLQRMTGANRTTIWRWKKRGPPPYVRTILDQQREIVKLRGN